MEKNAVCKNKNKLIVRHIVLPAVALVVAVAGIHFFSPPAICSILGTIALEVLTGIISQVVEKKACGLPRGITIVVCFVIIIACASNYGNSIFDKKDHIGETSAQQSIDKSPPEPEAVPPPPPPLEVPIPEDNHEVRTAVSFNTPGQIEAENNSGASFSPVLSEEEEGILFPHRSNFRSETDGPDEYTLKLESFLRENIQTFLHTVPNCPDDELNGSAILGQYFSTANTIDQEIKKGRSVALYEDLIGTYEQANSLGLKSSVISLQLARPYAEIIEIYPRNTSADCEKIFHYGIKGIHHYIETLSYESIQGAKDGDLLYRIGQIYHYMADVPNLDHAMRTELYQISSAYLSLAGEYETERYSGYTVYYEGMVKHKLGVISGKDSAFYLLDAAECYSQAEREQPLGRVLLGDAYKFESDVYTRLSNYVRKYGQGENLHSSKEY